MSQDYQNIDAVVEAQSSLIHFLHATSATENLCNPICCHLLGYPKLNSSKSSKSQV